VAVSRRLWIVPAAVLALVLVVALAEGWGTGGGHGRPPVQPFAAAASMSPATVSFGDRISARIDVVVDPRAVDPNSLDVQPRFGLYRVVGSTVKRTRGAGELRSYRYVLECLLPGCIPPSARVARRFPPATVSYRTRDGIDADRSVTWPVYQLLSRVTDADRRNSVGRMRFDASLPAVTYRVSPGTLRGLSIALAALLALGAVVLAWIALRPRAGTAGEGSSGSGLERALTAVRASTANGGGPTERRRALGWLGRELRAVERPSEADEARRLAWSSDPPTSRSAGDFAAEVESTEEPR
jgi:hypothetical protein